MSVSRRVVPWVVVALVASVAGCSGGGTGTDAGTHDAGAPVDAGNPDDGGHGPDAGLPIKYIVVIIKENHTFDNYFTGFPGATSSAIAKLSDGGTLERPAAPQGALDRDLCHAHSCTTTALNANKMDGFDKLPGARVNAAGTVDDLAFVRYTEAQIPNYWQYARSFVLADHFFSTTTGPSFPGHFAATSGFNVALSNPTCSCGGSCTVPAYDPVTCKITSVSPCWDAPSVVMGLPGGYTWAEYGWSTLRSNKNVAAMAGAASHFKAVSSLAVDLAGAAQPNLMFVHLSGTGSEHPPADVCPGENLTVSYLNTIMKGPHWKETAVFLLWDDWGGFYDSVAPDATPCATGDYVHPGFRVPLMVISPYAKPGYVLKTRSEQASIVKTIEDLWGLPRMHPQDARILDVSAGSLMEAFDFTQVARAPLLLNPRVCN